MGWVTKLLAPASLAFCLAGATAAFAAADATLFRLFLKDGSSLVSFGEFTRMPDRVIFSMPIGGTPDEPNLQLITLPADAVDWARTDRYSASARYQQYAATRGSEDFEQLSGEVAHILSEVAVTTDRRHALEIAESARKALADWPRSHFGYRQKDVSEIVTLLDEAISDLRVAAGMSRFDVTLVSGPAAEPAVEPLLGMPSMREQVDQMIRAAALSDRPTERLTMLRTAMSVIEANRSSISPREATDLKRSAEKQIRQEEAIDDRYNALTKRLMDSASKAAAELRISDVEGVLNKIPEEDARLGKRRPDTIQALRESVQAQLETARHKRLLQDQWTIRRDLYVDYQRAVGPALTQLTKVQPALDAIRRLDGPSPAALSVLRGGLEGGADRLGRITTPEDLRETHDMLVSAWRFAETAVNTRYTAISSGKVATAWEASSAAAGALLLISRVQDQLRAGLEQSPAGNVKVKARKENRARVVLPRTR